MKVEVYDEGGNGWRSVVVFCTCKHDGRYTVFRWRGRWTRPIWRNGNGLQLIVSQRASYSMVKMSQRWHGMPMKSRQSLTVKRLKMKPMKGNTSLGKDKVPERAQQQRQQRRQQRRWKLQCCDYFYVSDEQRSYMWWRGMILKIPILKQVLYIYTTVLVVYSNVRRYYCMDHHKI